MKVSAQYAQEHFADIFTAIDTGEEVELTRPGQSSVRLVLVESTPAKTRPSLLGIGKGEIWLADDWDSPETNNEIADLFENSVIFPETAPETPGA